MIPLGELLFFCAVGGTLGLGSGQLLGGLVGGLATWAAWVTWQLGWLHRQVGGEQPRRLSLLGHWQRLGILVRRGAGAGREASSAPVAEAWVENLYHLRDGVVWLDPRMHILSCNRVGEELLGLRVADRGCLLTSLVRTPQLVRYLAATEGVEAIELQSPRDRSRWLQLQLVRRRRVGGGLLLVRDITELHRLQQLRSDFTANVSHELRTPLTVLIGYLELLEEESASLPAGRGQALRDMRQQAERMSAMIDQLLDLARIESDAAQAPEEPVAVAALLGTVADSHASERGIQLQVDSAQELCLLGDGAELRTALDNLLSNALRYSPDSGVVRLDACWQRDRVVLSVSDQGPGIALSQRPRLTERFYRIPDDARSGTGLGLAIVHHILERHHAELRIEGEAGQGAVFRCLFPPSRSRRDLV